MDFEKEAELALLKYHRDGLRESVTSSLRKAYEQGKRDAKKNVERVFNRNHTDIYIRTRLSEWSAVKRTPN